MKLQALFCIGIALVLSGCGKEEAPPSAAAESAAESAAPEAEAMVAEPADMGTEAFIRHMHEHAAQLANIKAALDADDLEGAMTPAYWLSRHEGVSGPLYDWDEYLDQMRSAASDVASATDLDEARVAVVRIEQGCQGCHLAADVDIPGLRPKGM